MKKKTKSVILLVLLTVFCLLLFASCNASKYDIFDYDESRLGVMGKLVRWMHGWVGNYGWTVVVFTVFLKIVMSPLDIWQRYAARKSSLKMQQIQPMMESIDKKFGANTKRANEEKQKLYKKQGVGMLGSCLPMIVSMVIFFVMFAGLRNYSTYSSITNFRELTNIYYSTYSEQLQNSDVLRDYYLNGYVDGTTEYKGYEVTVAELRADTDNTADELEIEIRGNDAGIRAASVAEEALNGNNDICNQAESVSLAAVKAHYEEHHESWLWIKNVWQPDTWADIMQPYEGGTFEGGGFTGTVEMSQFPSDGKEFYNKLRDAVMEGDGYDGNGGWNGLMILPFASIGLSFLSMFISQRMERKNRKGEVVEQNAQQKVTNRTMMIIMPLMMAWFGFIYTGAFAIYMTVNYTLSIVSTIALRVPVEKLVLKRLNKDETKNKTVKASYKR